MNHDLHTLYIEEKNQEIRLQKVEFVSNHRGLTGSTFILRKYDTE